MINGIEYLFICLMSICISSLEKCLLRSFVDIIGLCLCWVLRAHICYKIYSYFFPFYGSSFSTLPPFLLLPFFLVVLGFELTLDKQTLYHLSRAPSPFCFTHFPNKVLHFCPCWPDNDPPTYASRIVGIAGAHLLVE
jgi:hypothetical protein